MMTLFRVLVLSVIAFGLPAPPAASAWRGKNFASHFDYLNIILIDTINFITLENSPIKSGA